MQQTIDRIYKELHYVLEYDDALQTWALFHMQMSTQVLLVL